VIYFHFSKELINEIEANAKFIILKLESKDSHWSSVINNTMLLNKDK
jgi:hypothetical protein